MFDEIDEKILLILQNGERNSNAEIARQVGLVPSAITERIRKLEERGIIRGYGVDLDPRKVGMGLTAFVFVRSNEPVGGDSTGDRLSAIPEVQEVHHIAGEDCYMVKLRAADTIDLRHILTDRFGAIETVTGTRTVIVLETIKETTHLPVDRSPLTEERRS